MGRENRWQDPWLHMGTDGLMEIRGKQVLICGTEEFCVDAQRELRRRGNNLLVTATWEVNSARQRAEEVGPAAILVEARVLVDGAGTLRQRRETLAASLALLAGYAPVVWVGTTEDGEEISQALRGVPLDFVPRSALCFLAAASMVERRLRSLTAAKSAKRLPLSPDGDTLEGRNFGGVLRHELNNPLTGILGNAELLLLEARRGRLDLPSHALQRLEVIAELAVRMRETVRQLSDRWEADTGGFSGEKEMPVEPPQWPVSG